MNRRKKTINFRFNTDAPDNRQSTTLRDDGAVDFTVDTQNNRYTAIDSATPAYDDAGNLTQDKSNF